MFVHADIFAGRGQHVRVYGEAVITSLTCVRLLALCEWLFPWMISR
jgi:hypothetical protein